MANDLTSTVTPTPDTRLHDYELQDFITGDPLRFCQQWQEQVELAVNLNDRPALQNLLKMLETVPFDVPSQMQAYRLYAQGFLQYSDKSFTAAEKSYRQTLAIAGREGGLQILFLSAERQLALALLKMGRANEAEDLFWDALEAFRRLQYRQGECRTLLGLAQLWYFRGNLEFATDYTEQALQIARAIGDDPAEATILSNLSVYYATMNRWQASIQLMLDCIELRKKIGNSSDLGIAYMNLGVTYESLHRLPEANEAYHRAAELLSQLDAPANTAHAYLNMAGLYVKMQQPQAAIAKATEAISLFRQINEKPLLARALTYAAEAEHRLGHVAVARAYLEEARELAGQSYDTAYAHQLANLFRSLGRVQALLAENEAERHQVIDFYQNALIKYEQTGDQQAAAEMLLDMGNYLFRAEYPDARRQALRAFEGLVKILGQQLGEQYRES